MTNWTHKDATLYQWDCVEWLQSNNQRFDCIVTSPPYNLGNPTKPSGMFDPTKGKDNYKTKIAHKDHYNDAKPEATYQSWLNYVVHLCLDHCEGLVWLNHKTRYKKKVGIHPLRYITAPFYSEVIWSRPGSITLNANKFAPSHELFIGFGTPSYWDKKSNTLMTVWKYPPRQDKEFVCPFPHDIIRRLLIASCKPNGIVLDPFCGSGTVGEVCADLGLRFVGLDKDSKSLAIAKRRIKAAYTKDMYCGLQSIGEKNE